MTSLLSLLLTAVAAFSATDTLNPNREYFNYPSVGLTKITVSNLKGDITIVPMELTTVKVSINKLNFSDRCLIKRDKSASLDEIAVSIEGPTGDECQTNLELQVPVDVALDLQTKAGNISVSGMEKSLKFFIAAGTLKVDGGKLKTVEGKSGAGIVDIKNFAGTGKIEMGAGSIDIAYSTSTPTGRIEVHSGTGTINLSFPKGTKLKSELQTGIGISQNAFADDHSGRAFGVAARTGAGNISVKTQ